MSRPKSKRPSSFFRLAAVSTAFVLCAGITGGIVATPATAAERVGYAENGIPLYGQVYLGAATTTSYPAFEQEVGGPTGVHRTYYQSNGVSSAVSTAMADHAAGRVPWVSFKLPYSWSQMKAGAGDAWAQDIANRLGALDGPVWVAFHHEPEGDGPPADWVAIQQRLSPIMQAKPNIAYSIILMGWHQFYSTNSNTSMAALWPGKEHVDILGFDPYNWYDTTSNSGGDKTYSWTELNSYYSKINAWLDSTGNSDVKWAIAETGYTDSAANVTQNMTSPDGKKISTRGPGSEWLTRAYDDMRAQGGIALTYFNVAPGVNNEPADWTWPLSTQLKKDIFSDILERSNHYNEPTPDYSAPSAPTNVSANPATTSANISWSVPESDGFAPIEKYEVKVAQGENVVKTVSTTSTSVNVTGLTAGTEYTVTVKATNAVGTSAASDAHAFSTAALSGGPVTFEAVAQSNVNAEKASVTIPSAVSAGDGLFLYVTTNTTATASTPNGWVKVASVPDGDMQTHVFKRTASSSDAGSTVSSNLGATSKVSTIVAAYSNVDMNRVTVEVEAEEVTRNAHTAPAVLPPGNNSKTISYWADKSSATTSWTTPTGVTKRSQSIGSGSGRITATIGDRGASDATTATANSSSNKATMVTLGAPAEGQPPVVAPNAPTGVTVTPSKTSADVSWPAPVDDGGAPVTGYEVQVMQDEDIVKTASSTSTNANITGLTPGTAYSVSVKAINAVGSSEASASEDFFTKRDVPSVPSLVVSETTASQISIDWSDDSSADEYEVYRDGELVETVFDSEYTDVGLAPNETHSYKVLATNETGSSAFSAVVSGTTQDVAPAAPTGVNVATEPTSAYVTWSVPSGNGGTPITGYEVTVNRAGEVVSVVMTDATSANIESLVPGTDYSVFVKAVNAAGASPASTHVDFTTSQNIPAPTVPVVSVSETTESSVTLDWSNVANADEYDVYRDGEFVEAVSDSEYQDTGLGPNQTHSYAVVAKNATGSSAASASVIATTLDVAPNAPTSVVATPGVTDSAVSWSAPADNGGTPVTGYEVKVFQGGSLVQSVPSATTSVTVPGLTANTSYSVVVKAANAAGSSPASAAVAFTTKRAIPAVPVVSVSDRTASSIELDWVNVANADEYYVYRDGSLVATVSASEYSDTGLHPNETHSYAIAAANTTGVSAASAVVTGTTLDVAPNAPTGVTAAPGVTDSVISWTAPAGNGGTAVTGYEVKVSHNGTVVNTASTANTSVSVPDLAANTNYSVVVKAVNAAGASPASATVDFSTKRAIPATPVVSVSARTSSSITLDWVNTPNADEYEVYRDGEPVGTTQASNYLDAGLSPNSTYVYAVTAKNETGTSAASTPVSATTQNVAPNAPTGVVAASTVTSATISWNAPTPNGGTDVTGYEVKVSQNGTVVKTVSSATTSVNVPGLTGGTGYTATVTANNSAGASSPSAAGNFTTRSLAAYKAVAHTNVNTLTPTVTVPATVTSGDGLFLFITTNTLANASTPAGWTKIATVPDGDMQTNVYKKTAGSTDAGTNVTVDLSTISKTSAVLSVYKNVNVDAVTVAASAEAVTQNAHTAPAVTVQSGEGIAVSHWADKSSATTSWAMPSGTTSRALSVGASSGRIVAVVGDRATGAAATATADAASGKATMVTLSLPSK